MESRQTFTVRPTHYYYKDPSVRPTHFQILGKPISRREHFRLPSDKSVSRDTDCSNARPTLIIMIQQNIERKIFHKAGGNAP